jgi:hypothetical protein
MLSIRKEQMAVFEKVAEGDFENRMLSHIKEFFPEQHGRFAESSLREFIHYGVDRAAAYGIELQPDVCQFIDLMLVFGRDFDHDPALPWASTILNDPEIPGPTARIYELQNAVAALQAPQGDE